MFYQSSFFFVIVKIDLKCPGFLNIKYHIHKSIYITKSEIDVLLFFYRQLKVPITRPRIARDLNKQAKPQSRAKKLYIM